MKRKRVEALLMAAMMLAMSGCGQGGATDTGKAVDIGTTAANAPKEETIKLGVVTALSGERASVGEYAKLAAELYKKQVNEKGGINGKMVDIVYEDEGATEQSVINAMVKLYSRDDIVGVFTTTLSSNVIAASPTIEKYRISTVASGSSTNIPPLNNQYLWQARTTDDLAGRIIAKAAVEELGMKKPAIIHLSDSWGAGISRHTINALKEMDVEPVLEINVNLDEKQFSPFLTQIVNSEADGIIMLAHQQESSIIAMQADAMSINLPRIGASGLASPVALQTAGDAANGWYAVTDWTTEVQTESGKAFVQAFEAEYSKAPDLQSAFAYDGLSIMGKAIELAGSTDHEAVNKALAEVKDMPGASGVFTASEQRVFGTSLFLVKIEDQTAKLMNTVSR